MSKKIKQGRPKAEPAKKLNRRHVVNISPEVETAVEGFCSDTGISRITDGLRALIVKSLKAEGRL